MKYRVFAALYEEATEGWVWLATPHVEPHRLIAVKTPGSRRKIYCEARTLDENFVKFYNSKPHTHKIDLACYGNVLVIGDWYRQALGITSTQTDVVLDIRQRKIPLWSALKAGSQHPDPTVRSANRLGLLGTWLGLVGLIGVIEPLTKLFNRPTTAEPITEILCVVLLVFGVGCAWGAHGIWRSKNRAEPR